MQSKRLNSRSSNEQDRWNTGAKNRADSTKPDITGDKVIQMKTRRSATQRARPGVGALTEDP